MIYYYLFFCFEFHSRQFVRSKHEFRIGKWDIYTIGKKNNKRRWWTWYRKTTEYYARTPLVRGHRRRRRDNGIYAVAGERQRLQRKTMQQPAVFPECPVSGGGVHGFSFDDDRHLRFSAVQDAVDVQRSHITSDITHACIYQGDRFLVNNCYLRSSDDR